MFVGKYWVLLDNKRLILYYYISLYLHNARRIRDYNK